MSLRERQDQIEHAEQFVAFMAAELQDGPYSYEVEDCYNSAVARLRTLLGTHTHTTDDEEQQA
jgi:hypothetical protein